LIIGKNFVRFFSEILKFSFAGKSPHYTESVTTKNELKLLSGFSSTGGQKRAKHVGRAENSIKGGFSVCL